MLLGPRPNKYKRLLVITTSLQHSSRETTVSVNMGQGSHRGHVTPPDLLRGLNGGVLGQPMLHARRRDRVTFHIETRLLRERGRNRTTTHVGFAAEGITPGRTALHSTRSVSSAVKSDILPSFVEAARRRQPRMVNAGDLHFQVVAVDRTPDARGGLVRPLRSTITSPSTGMLPSCLWSHRTAACTTPSLLT
ncbi:hypothetical protein ISCGN_005403 [Ixodes scapularis]